MCQLRFIFVNSVVFSIRFSHCLSSIFRSAQVLDRWCFSWKVGGQVLERGPSKARTKIFSYFLFEIKLYKGRFDMFNMYYIQLNHKIFKTIFNLFPWGRAAVLNPSYFLQLYSTIERSKCKLCVFERHNCCCFLLNGHFCS